MLQLQSRKKSVIRRFTMEWMLHDELKRMMCALARRAIRARKEVRYLLLFD